jgi:DNA-binding CsgD family transcriptional regulator
MAQSSGSTGLGAIPAFASTRTARLASGIDGRCNPGASYVSLYLWTTLDLGSDSPAGIPSQHQATWAILRDFARRTREEKTRRRRFVTGRQDFLQSVVDHRNDDLPELICREQSTEAVRSLLSQLNDRERTILVHRFGLVDDKRTLGELGRELGISKERVRQLEVRALRKLGDTAEGGEA